MNFIISKSAILRKINSPLDISNVFVPTSLKKGQVLVKMIYSGICGSQLGEIKGIKGKDNYLPHLLGHEGIAKVIKVDRRVKKVKSNDIALLHWMPSDGCNATPPVYYDKNKKKINAGYLSTFNEYAIVSENRLTKIKKKKFFSRLFVIRMHFKHCNWIGKQKFTYLKKIFCHSKWMWCNWNIYN